MYGTYPVYICSSVDPCCMINYSTSSSSSAQTTTCTYSVYTVLYIRGARVTIYFHQTKTWCSDGTYIHTYIQVQVYGVQYVYCACNNSMCTEYSIHKGIRTCQGEGCPTIHIIRLGLYSTYLTCLWLMLVGHLHRSYTVVSWVLLYSRNPCFL